MKLCPVLEYLRWNVIQEDGNPNSFELSQQHMQRVWDICAACEISNMKEAE